MSSLTHRSAAHGAAYRSQRAFSFAVIAGLHAVVIVLIVTGFARTTVQRFMESTATIVDEPVRDERLPPPPPADPQLQPPVVDLGPPPDLPFDFAPDNGGTALTGPVVAGPVAAPVIAQPVALPIRVVGKHRLPNTDDYYPASEIRAGVEGTSTVGVCVDASGKRSSDPKVVQSSGSARLDEGAMHVLRDGRYARAMQGDEYVPNCYQFRISFKLK